MEPVYRHYPWKALLSSGTNGVAVSRYGRSLMRDIMYAAVLSRDAEARPASEGNAMDGKKLLPAIGSVLCVALAVWLAAAAIGIYREGLARQEADPLEPIWSPELVTERLLPIAPLFLLTAALPIAGAVVRSRDGNGRNGETERGPERDGGGRIGEAERAPLSDRKALRTALLLAAVALLAAGAFNGSARDVFGKAVRICTECIGLG